MLITNPAAKYVPKAEKAKKVKENKTNATRDRENIGNSKNERRIKPITVPSIIPIIPPIEVIMKISANGIRWICLKVPPNDWKTAKSFILDTASKVARTLADIIEANKANSIKNVKYRFKL
jgi:hypothetical protein